MPAYILIFLLWVSASKAKNEIDWWNSQYIKGLQDDELMSWGQ